MLGVKSCNKTSLQSTASDWNEIFTTITWMQFGGFALRAVVVDDDDDVESALFCGVALTPLTA